MTFNTTKLEGCFIIEPKVIQDERGFFMESFNAKTFRDVCKRKFCARQSIVLKQRSTERIALTGIFQIGSVF
jgi:dTDP-4-dehydrorhamnose 3,5-epimerase-like enzyme